MKMMISKATPGRQLNASLRRDRSRWTTAFASSSTLTLASPRKRHNSNGKIFWPSKAKGHANEDDRTTTRNTRTLNSFGFGLCRCKVKNAKSPTTTWTLTNRRRRGQTHPYCHSQQEQSCSSQPENNPDRECTLTRRHSGSAFLKETLKTENNLLLSLIHSKSDAYLLHVCLKLKAERRHSLKSQQLDQNFSKECRWYLLNRLQVKTL